jgi:hypothetical protein
VATLFLNLDMHAYLPAENRVFYYIKVLPDGHPWSGPSSVYYTTAGYVNYGVDLTQYIPQGTTRIRINLGVVNWPAGETTHTPSPIYDNVSIWATLPPDDPAPKPDLTVTNYTSDPAMGATIADLVRFDATVKNHGPEPAWSSVMNWTVGTEAKQFPIPEDDSWTRVFEAGDETYITRSAVWNNYLYLVGLTKGAFPGHTNSGGWDAFVQKRSLTGTPPVWTRQFGTASNEGPLDIVADDTGVYVCGTVNAALPGSQSWGGSDGYVRGYDFNGNLLWTNQFGTNMDDVAHGISLRNGQVLVCGDTEGTFVNETNAGGKDAYTKMFGIENGVAGWDYQFGTAANESAIEWVRDETGVSYITGYISNGAFDGQTAYGDDDVFVQQNISPPAWLVQFGTIGADRPTAIAMDDSSVYVAGYCSGELPGQTYVQGRDAFVGKYHRTTGALIWADQFGSQGDDQVFDIEFFNECIVAAGKVGDPSLVYSLPGQTGKGKIDQFVRRYSAAGDVRTTRQFGTSDN